MVIGIHRISRAAAILRLMPALAWLAVQLSMTTLPVVAAEPSHTPEIAALFQALGVDRIVLCTPGGEQVFEKHDEHAGHEECQWCQGFAWTILPTPTTESVRVVLSGTNSGFKRNTAKPPSPSPDRRPPSRAPPTSI